jgi:hypothetical protein
MTQTITIKDPGAPATEKQVSFLNSLIKDRECPSVAERFELAQKLGFLGKGAASSLIDAALKAPKKTAPATGTFLVAQVPETLTPKTPEPAVVALTEAPAFGYYDIDGTLYHWDVTGKDYKPTLRRLFVVVNYDGTKKGSWKKTGGHTAGQSPQKISMTFTPYAGKGYNKSAVTAGTWVPGIIVKAVQAGIVPLTQDEAAAKGKAFTFCIRCGATLTDPVSVADGIGPVCKGYWS